MRPADWPALAAARAHDAAARVPFVVNGREVGSVGRAHLRPLSGLPLRVDSERVALDGDAPALSAALARINTALRAQGLILAWRDEPFALFDPASGEVLAMMERAATRFWGTLTLGAHANGYVADAAGRPQRLWIARRAATKATDPGKHDNLVGGGVPAGQTPLQALQRESWEEAGLSDALVRQARPGRVIRLQRDIPEGLQHEWLHAYDIKLPADTLPANQDGEVAGFECLAIDEALQLAAGATMTVDAALVTLDFALRHGLLDAAVSPTLARQLNALLVPERWPT